MLLDMRVYGCRLRAIGDTGPPFNFVDASVVARLGLPSKRLAFPVQLHSIDGKSLDGGQVDSVATLLLTLLAKLTSDRQTRLKCRARFAAEWWRKHERTCSHQVECYGPSQVDVPDHSLDDVVSALRKRIST
jgi:hypothetical protein